MKLLTFSHALWLSSLAAFASIVPLAHAQTAAKVVVPFAFNCGPSHMAAGTYLISNNGHIALIRGTKTTGNAMTMTFQNDRAYEPGRALFTRVGERYTLKDLWVAGQPEHLHFVNPKLKTRPERASIEQRPQDVEVALLEPGVINGGR